MSAKKSIKSGKPSVAAKKRAHGRIRRRREETPEVRAAWNRYYGASEIIRHCASAFVHAGHELDTIPSKALKLALELEAQLESIKPAESRYGRR